MRSIDRQPIESDQQRIERLERSVRFLRIAVVLLVLCALIPALGAVIGFSLLILAIPVGVIALIGAMMCVLDWLFPGDRSEA